MRTWLLLLHHIPPTPLYLRAQVLRRLKQIGALPLKRSAYLLPDEDETREDLEWVRREVEAGGGSAWIFRVQGVAGLADGEAEQAFRDLRERDYAAILDEARALATSLRGKHATSPDDARRALRKLVAKLETLRRIDWFEAPGRVEVESIVTTIENKLGAPEGKPETGAARAKLWVTRRGVKSDRMASAWLIRRFIDPEARFAFVDAAAYRHDGRALRFDMYDGEYTHEGERCTFEVLLERFGLGDAALAAIGEVIHDIDCKEIKHARPETAGVAVMLEGIAARHADDNKRLEESGPLFDALHARLRR